MSDDRRKELSDLYGRPIECLEDYVMAMCGTREWVPGSWSDWWSLVCATLAMLYQRRGQQTGLSPGVWAHGVLEEAWLTRRMQHFLGVLPGEASSSDHDTPTDADFDVEVPALAIEVRRLRAEWERCEAELALEQSKHYHTREALRALMADEPPDPESPEGAE